MATTAANTQGLTIQTANVSELQLTAAGDRVQLIPLDEIAFSPTNPRKHINQAELESLAQNILTSGLLQPVTLRKAPESLSNDLIGPFTYELVAGERRLRAHMILRERGESRFAVIPSIVREVGDEELLKLQIAENLQREDLTPLDWAAAYRAMVDLKKQMQGEGEGSESSAVQIVAAELGKSASVIYQAMQLLNLIPEARDMLRDREMSKNHGIDCARLETTEQRQYIDRFKLLSIESGGTPSVRTMRDWIEDEFGGVPEARVELQTTSEDKPMVGDDDRAKLKRFEDAIGGRKLSGTAAFQVNEAISGFGKIGGYDEGDKLNANSKRRLQEICDEMRDRGITPAETLLTEFQQKALYDRAVAADQDLKAAHSEHPASKNTTTGEEARLLRTENDYDKKRRDRLEQIRTDVRKVHAANLKCTGQLLVGINADLIAEALFDALDFEDVQLLCDLFGWAAIDEDGEVGELEHVRSQYYKNWARDHELFLLTAAALALGDHQDADREQFMERYFKTQLVVGKPTKPSRNPLGKKNDAKLAKVAPAKPKPATKPAKRELSSAELASLPLVNKAAVRKPAKKAAKKSTKKGGRP